MNLFCFTLEGSTDSLYRPMESKSAPQESAVLPSRPSTTRAMKDNAKWGGSEPCIATLHAQEQRHTSNSKKAKRKSHTPGARLSTGNEALGAFSHHTPGTRLSTGNETLGVPDCTNVYWQTSMPRGDRVQINNGHNEVSDDEPVQARLLPEEDAVRQLTLERRERGQTTQTVNFEAWNPNWEPSDSRHHDVASEAEGEAEARGTLKRFQKLVRVKRGSQNSTEEAKSLPDTHDKGALLDVVFKEDSPVITCIGGQGKRPERRAGREQQQQQQQPQGGERSSGDVDAPWSPSLQHQYQWNSTEISPLPWDSTYHTCQRPRTTRPTDTHLRPPDTHLRPPDPHLYSFNFTLPHGTDWDRYESLVQELDRGRRSGLDRGRGRGSAAQQLTPPRVVLSATHQERTDSTRSSSFGKFETFRHQARQSKPDENGATVSIAEAAEAPDGEQARQGTIGRKMKAISMTMRKRMGRKYIKALSEEAGEDPDGDHEAEGDSDAGAALAKACRRSSNSLESLYSRHSGQSSSSGITSGSEGSSNRDSLRLEEAVPYTGQFCGRARVHTDFVPSPYDTESLRLKVGDVIEVISKPAMGIWTGLLHNRVGSFKFIYVDLLVEKEPEPRRRTTSQGRSRRPRPNTLLELLACLHLEEHASSLMLNGYQTVEDLRELSEQHLIELNMMDPAHRHRLLAATECLHEPDPKTPKDEEADEEATSPGEVQKAELKDCPRDSGCYIPSDASDSSSRDDATANLVALNSSPAEP